MQVVDEIDRMLRQSYQDWLPFVMEAIRQNASRGDRVVKIVASATLTQDPAKLQRLELYAPRYIAMSSTDNRYAVFLRFSHDRPSALVNGMQSD